MFNFGDLTQDISEDGIGKETWVNVSPNERKAPNPSAEFSRLYNFFKITLIKYSYLCLGRPDSSRSECCVLSCSFSLHNRSSFVFARDSAIVSVAAAVMEAVHWLRVASLRCRGMMLATAHKLLTLKCLIDRVCC